MSTLGVAHHQQGTFPKLDNSAETARREARYAAKDAAYRAFVCPRGGPLPKAIGHAVSHNRGGVLTALRTGGKHHAPASWAE